jgi:hypothetical protein
MVQTLMDRTVLFLITPAVVVGRGEALSQIEHVAISEKFNALLLERVVSTVGERGYNATKCYNGLLDGLTNARLTDTNTPNQTNIIDIGYRIAASPSEALLYCFWYF